MVDCLTGEELPGLLIHRVHNSPSTTPHALPYDSLAGIITTPKAPGDLAFAAVLLIESASIIDEGPEEPLCKAVLGPGNLHVTHSNGDPNSVCEVEIPLRLAEIDVGTCRLPGAQLGDACDWAERPLLALVDGAESCVWLVIVDAAPESVRAVLDAMGARGAVRLDIHESFHVADSAFASGSTAEIWRATPVSHIGDAEELVLKIMTEATRQADDVLGREATILIEAQRHPNIVRFHGLFRVGAADQSGHAFRSAMMLEWCPHGDFHDVLSIAGPREEQEARDIVHALVDALAFIHGRGIVHRDVKAENLLIAADFRPVLTDFGIAAHLSDTVAMACRCGSPGYAAPEILDGKEYDSRVDVFGAGVILYLALSLTLPFFGPDIASVLRRTMRGKIRFESSAHFDFVSREAKHFVLDLLRSKPSDRLTAKAALGHPWLAGVHCSQEVLADERPEEGMHLPLFGAVSLPAPVLGDRPVMQASQGANNRAAARHSSAPEFSQPAGLQGMIGPSPLGKLLATDWPRDSGPVRSPRPTPTAASKGAAPLQFGSARDKAKGLGRRWFKNIRPSHAPAQLLVPRPSPPRERRQDPCNDRVSEELEGEHGMHDSGRVSTSSDWREWFSFQSSASSCSTSRGDSPCSPRMSGSARTTYDGRRSTRTMTNPQTIVHEDEVLDDCEIDGPTDLMTCLFDGEYNGRAEMLESKQHRRTTRTTSTPSADESKTLRRGSNDIDVGRNLKSRTVEPVGSDEAEIGEADDGPNPAHSEQADTPPAYISEPVLDSIPPKAPSRPRSLFGDGSKGRTRIVSDWYTRRVAHFVFPK